MNKIIKSNFHMGVRLVVEKLKQDVLQGSSLGERFASRASAGETTTLVVMINGSGFRVKGLGLRVGKLHSELQGSRVWQSSPTR
jgi:hypothetical protein